jgi:myosin heavy subunit
LLEQASLANRQASARSGELETALACHQVAKTEGKALTKSLLELQQELQQEKDTQLSLNQQSKAQIQKTEKLNEQQITLIELTQSRHDELRNELSSALETAKKYQTKLQQTETKLKDVGDLQARLLKNAAKALIETSSQNGKFNSSISKFQHSTEQSQQLVIRTQTTLESILTRNQLLERENKLLAQKLNSLSSTPAQPRGNAAAPSTMGFGTFNELNFSDPQSGHQVPIDNKNGFFKLMVVLAIVIPLSFIAHSLFNSVNAKQLNSTDLLTNSNKAGSTDLTRVALLTDRDL